MFMLYLIIVLVIVSIIKFWNYLRICYYLKKFPGPKPLPIVGNALLFRGTYNDYASKFLKWGRKYGDVYVFWLGPLPLVMISNADLMKKLISSTTVLDKAWFLKYIVQDYGDAVGVSSGEKWKRNIKLIRSGFSLQMLDTFLPLFNEKTKILVEQMEKELNSPTPFKAFRYYSRATLDAVCENILGINMSSQVRYTPYFEAIRSDSRMFMARLLKIWLFPNFTFKRSAMYPKHEENVKIIYGVIENALNARKQQDKNTKLISHDRLTLLDVLLAEKENDPNLTDEQIKDEANFVIAAGYVTTAITLGYASLCLGARKQIQNQVYDEIYNIFGTSDRTVDVEDIPKLVYLDMVIRETLRLFPTVPFAMRETLMDISLGNDYIIPKDTQILLSIFNIHRDPNVWENPEEFNPNRFLTDKSPFGYFPFGGGRRLCAGMNYAILFMKVILVNVLRKYEIHTNLDINNLNLITDLTLSVIGGHLITITERQKKHEI